MSTAKNKFAGKIALVTGAARGIGRAVALKLAQEGADVAINYRQETARAEELANEIRALGRRAITIQANVADPEAIAHMFVAVRDFGGLDFLVNNAATGRASSLLEATLKGWDLAMNVNARALLLTAQAAVPMMRERGGGRIVAMTARIATDRAFPDYGVVAASKGAIHALTTYMAIEFAPFGIVVNAVSPGMVATDAPEHFPAGPGIVARAKAHTPVGRITTAEDVAELVAFLCTDGAHQISGQIVVMDGGYTRLFL